MLDNKVFEVTENGILTKAFDATEIKIPTRITGIDKGAFSGCTGLRHIVVPEGITHIGEEAFKDCVALQTVSLPSTLQSIGENAFIGCNDFEIIYNGLLIDFLNIANRVELGSYPHRIAGNDEELTDKI